MTDTTPIATVLVAGSGTMGRGIAKSFAEGGFEVSILSRDPARLTDLPAGVTALSELPAAAPDLIIETIIERMEDKRALFARLSAAYGDAPIVGSNTSGLPLPDLAAAYGHPQRFVGIHYLQPADVFPMVELICLPETSETVLQRTAVAIRRTAKEPLIQRKAVPGFLVNRLQHAILHEAYHLVETGVCDVEAVDNVAKYLLGPRMCVTGLIQQKDIGGLETHALAQRAIVPHLHHGAEPNPILQTLYAEGKTGLSAGQGFYDWSGQDPKDVRRDATAKLNQLLAYLKSLVGGPVG
ncbi:3-hydroxyacyl-CoA dehydrogenase NAD-binding domain-containing protein [Oceanibaculum pacificum]|uniref:3-hydroxybutyryl-CoA dehydrogenase n=1 Tax=Oceanibaculum pacificum TaxID=580166 RepID=A0A154VYT2_9PROT|nr:3-hydroxyacyl-CoA dehydrogenase NAD-binding domain-containing protein [Oceanibaculum pacificum]KZD06408.1 hypothetical protein AUP43_10820 [Oceanibaculum pacificum]